MKLAHKIVPYNSKKAYKERCFLPTLIGLLLLCWLPCITFAATKLQGIEYSSLPGKSVQLRLEFSAPVAKPTFFAIDDPARIVLDFPGVKIGTARQSQVIGAGMTRSVTMVEAADRTRVVVNLIQSVPFETRVDKNFVYVTVNGSPAGASTEESGAAHTGRHLIKNIDFRRGEAGEGRVIVSLSDTQAPVDIREEGKRIIVDFMNTTLPNELERRLDVVDFATPVKFIDTSTKNQNVRMVIAPADVEHEYLSYQSDDMLVVELKPLTKKEKELARKKEFGYVGEKLSLNFQSIEVRSVLQLIADFTGLNLVASDTVQGSVTLRLKNVPWDQALDIILKTKGLAMRRMGNVVLVAPSEEIAAREKLELETRKQVEELAPLGSEFIQVNFAKASNLAALIQSEENSLLSARGHATFDERTNTLLVMDTADRLAALRKLVASLDIPVRQVLIESRVVIASSDFSRELGVRFGLSKQDKVGGAFDQVTTSGSLNGTTQIINQETLELQDRLNVNFPVTKKDAAKIALALTNLPLGALLELELSALQAEGRGEVISNPRVITSNQKEAIIEQGTEIPYQRASSSGATSVSFKKAVLSLKVTPQITPDDRIIMDLGVTKDSVGKVFAGVPSINTREVSTQVLVNNGQTVVLGGIYEQEKNRAVRRIPFLGDLPYAGILFRDKTEFNNKRELLIFVTPKIIKEGARL
ncbi:type IV pilus secretin PilQ [Nitrosococcus watsonii]|uniref:Type IV pilus secretin PilQ n=1 Tax=Nitrosococcus watsoni (strain C-113) TaxID=105559 RepID=D8K9N0_NITWC|nr:type IV pilus secretin PilQ [Nitrosococcus watsonii]ADJ27319.1 type IV pilus secretin PilQ [Nitrosococcus watsonii C-113]